MPKKIRNHNELQKLAAKISACHKLALSEEIEKKVIQISAQWSPKNLGEFLFHKSSRLEAGLEERNKAYDELPETIAIPPTLAHRLVQCDKKYQQACGKSFADSGMTESAVGMYIDCLQAPLKPSKAISAVKKGWNVLEGHFQHVNNIKEINASRTSAEDIVLSYYRLIEAPHCFILRKGNWGTGRWAVNEYRQNIFPEIQNIGIDKSVNIKSLEKAYGNQASAEQGRA